jgi:lysylphosphatidylglycerol synthetase-like protein (DUF2156 family)
MEDTVPFHTLRPEFSFYDFFWSSIDQLLANQLLFVVVLCAGLIVVAICLSKAMDARHEAQMEAERIKAEAQEEALETAQMQVVVSINEARGRRVL